MVCHHAKILHGYGLYSSHWPFHSHDSVYFATGCFCLLISFTPTFLPSGSHPFVLCIYNCFLFCYFYSFVLVFKSLHMSETISVFVIRLISFSLLQSVSIHIVTDGKVSSFFVPECYFCVRVCVPHLDPFIRCWILVLLPYLGYCCFKKCYDEHRGAYIFPFLFLTELGLRCCAGLP